MKTRKYLKNFIMIVLLSLTISAGTFLCAAAGTTPWKAGQEISLTLDLGKTSEVSAFSIYQVESWNENGFQKTDAFRGFQPDPLEDISVSAIVQEARDLQKYIENNAIRPDWHGTTVQGSVTFSQLSAGIYLVAQSADTANTITVTENPYLLLLPSQNAEGDGYVYNVTSLPKYTHLTPASADESDPTPDPGDDTVTGGGGTEPPAETETPESRPGRDDPTSDVDVTTGDPGDGRESGGGETPADRETPGSRPDVDDSTPDPGDDTVTEGGGTEPSTEGETPENRPDGKVSSDDPEDGDDSESSAAPYDPGVSDSNDDASGGSGSGGNTQSSGTNPRSGNTPASGNAGPAFPNGGNASPSGNAGSAVSNAATQSVEDAIPIHPIDAEGNPIVPEENRYATIDDLPDNVIFEDLIPMGDGYFYDPAQGSFYFIGSESMAHTRIKDDKVPLGAYVLGRMGDDNLPTTILALIAILSGTGCIILYHRRKEEDD